jgi:hypothetical protein
MNSEHGNQAGGLGGGQSGTHPGTHRVGQTSVQISGQAAAELACVDLKRHVLAWIRDELIIDPEPVRVAGTDGTPVLARAMTETNRLVDAFEAYRGAETGRPLDAMERALVESYLCKAAGSRRWQPDLHGGAELLVSIVMRGDDGEPVRLDTNEGVPFRPEFDAAAEAEVANDVVQRQIAEGGAG